MHIKFSKLTNHYQEKSIRDWTERFPKMEQMDYVITEKLDGSNIQMIYQPNEPIVFGSRNQQITPGELFQKFDFWEPSPMDLFHQKVQSIVDAFGISLIFYMVLVLLIGFSTILSIESDCLLWGGLLRLGHPLNHSQTLTNL